MIGELLTEGERYPVTPFAVEMLALLSQSEDPTK